VVDIGRATDGLYIRLGLDFFGSQVAHLEIHPELIAKRFIRYIDLMVVIAD
jgi:hypothetical protein